MNNFHRIASVFITLMVMTGCGDEGAAVGGEITIASFNIQNFDESKAADAAIMERLVHIIRQYDIVAIQEVQGDKDVSLNEILKLLNVGGGAYDFASSSQLGSSFYSEQYAVFFNTEKVKLLASAEYDDTSGMFTRKPLCAHFSSGDFDFLLINIHTKPDNAEDEIDALVSVIIDSSYAFDEHDVIILGDLNADGAYAENDCTSCFLKKLPALTWIVTDNTDTTVTPNNAFTYDRIIMTTGATTEDYTGQWGVYDYTSEFGLTYEEAKTVTDHFPVWAVFHTDADTD